MRLPLSEAYPLVQLEETTGYHCLGAHPLLMLVALTGTGKSATLQCLKRMMGAVGMGVIPSRRELADWIALPMMQTLAGEELLPVNDRVQALCLYPVVCRARSRRHGGGIILAVSGRIASPTWSFPKESVAITKFAMR